MYEINYFNLIQLNLVSIQETSAAWTRSGTLKTRVDRKLAITKMTATLHTMPLQISQRPNILFIYTLFTLL